MTPAEQRVYAASRIREIAERHPAARDHLRTVAERLEDAADLSAPPLAMPPTIFEALASWED